MNSTFTAALTQAELEAWGERVGREVDLPVVIALHGDLGAGKSTFARAAAHGAGVVGGVPSPTFNLLFVYETSRARVYHFDLYRLKRADEVWELGWEEMGSGRDLVLIEWAARAADLLPEPRWDVVLEETGDPDRRRIEVRRVGEPPVLPDPPPQEAI